jgi:hypothetical protein
MVVWLYLAANSGVYASLRRLGYNYYGFLWTLRIMKKFVTFLLVLCAVAYVAWPYIGVWQLERVVVEHDQEGLARSVDLMAVRGEIKRRLNKEAGASVGNVSNAFVNWLQDGIRRLGQDAINRLVTLDWVRQQLLSKTKPADPPGFVRHISYAFFDGPGDFLVRIGELGEDPVHLRLTLTTAGWRVTAMYN